jgi:UDP-N-acetyl-D-mannosaminuronate dehydrogenase
MFGPYHGHVTTLSTHKPKHKAMASSSVVNLPQNIGWIGLGLMGLPMATNLLKKMDKDTTFYVFDVVEESVKKLVEAGEGRVKACESSKEVTDKSVRHQLLIRLRIKSLKPP